ncbi:MAG: ABC transporter substrate-binding protein [Rhodoglobus sp.]
MKFWKSATLAGAAALALIGLSACSSTGSPAASDEPVTLTYAMWQQPEVPLYEKFFADFHKENPNITVKIQLTGFAQYAAKLQNAASNQALPDVFWLDVYNFPLYASTGQLAPIDGSGKDGESVYAEQWSFDGDQYGTTLNRNTMVMWYNKDLFDKAGVAYPEASWTWDDFRSTAKTLTDPAAGTWGTEAVLLQGGARSIQSTIVQAGGSMLTDDSTKSGFNDPKTQQGVELWQQIAQDGSTPTQTQLAQTDPNTFFTSGKIGMMVQRDGLASVLVSSPLFTSGRIGVVTLPHGPKGNMAQTTSVGNVMPANAKHPEASAKLIEFLGSQDVAAEYAKTGGGFTPYPETDQYMVDFYKQYIDLTPALLAEKNSFASETSLNSAAWLTQISDQLQPVMDLTTSVADGSAKLATGMDAALAKEKSQK